MGSPDTQPYVKLVNDGAGNLFLQITDGLQRSQINGIFHADCRDCRLSELRPRNALGARCPLIKLIFKDPTTSGLLVDKDGNPIPDTPENRIIIKNAAQCTKVHN